MTRDPMTPVTPGVYDTCSFWLTVARNALEFFKQGTYLLVELLTRHSWVLDVLHG